LRRRLTGQTIAVAARDPTFQEMEEMSPTNVPANDTTAETSPGRARLMLSLALGVIDLTNERVGAVLAACSAIAPPVELEPAPPGAPVDVRHAALGFLTSAIAGVSRAPARARARLRRVAASARRRAAPLDRANELARRVPGLPRAMGRLRAWRDRGREQVARWAELGRRQQAQSRVLAFDALTVLRENMLARVSESPELKDVIREQSTGIAVTAMSELRESSARADSLVERTVGRLLHDGHSPRTR
jgi:hypothetical protein